MADLPATARIITDEAERRPIIERVCATWNRTDRLEAFVAGAPLIEVTFDDPVARWLPSTGSPSVAHRGRRACWQASAPERPLTGPTPQRSNEVGDGHRLPHEVTNAEPLSAEEIVALSKQHTLYEWLAQSAADPIPVATREGLLLLHGRRRALPRLQQPVDVREHRPRRPARHRRHRGQAQRLAYRQPLHGPRAARPPGRKLAELTPGDLDVVFFTNGGAEANENAIKLARQFTGRQKILARYRSYHGATGQAIAATGDPRRWAAETGVSGIVRAPDFHKWGRPEPEPVERALQELEDVVMYEGGHTIAAFILEPVVGTNGILIPPDGYLQGVREICDRHGILLIADEVMTGFGRTGRWFAVDHWGVVPDLLTMAKGLTSSYLPLGAVAMRQHIADAFRERAYVGGLTYNSHPMGCAAALAVIEVYEQDGLVERSARMGEVMRGHHERLMRAPSRASAATATSASSASWTWSATARTYEPMAPYDGTSDEMKAIHHHLRDARPVHVPALQHDPHQPAADHQRGGAGRGLRHHRRGPRPGRRGRPRLRDRAVGDVQSGAARLGAAASHEVAAGHQRRQLGLRGPAGRLAEAAVGHEREARLRHAGREQLLDALGDVVGRLDVVVLDVDDARREVPAGGRDVGRHVQLRHLAVGPLEHQLADVEGQGLL